MVSWWGMTVIQVRVVYIYKIKVGPRARNVTGLSLSSLLCDLSTNFTNHTFVESKAVKMGEMMRATRHLPTMPTIPTMTTSYVVATFTENEYTEQVTYATLIYDPQLVSSSTQTTFYTSRRYGKGPDHPFEVTVPVYTAEIPVIPTSTASSSIPTSPHLATSTAVIVQPVTPHHSSLSGAAIAGVAIGAIVAAIFGLVIAAFLIGRRRQQRKQASAPIVNEPKRPRPQLVAPYPLAPYKSSRSSSMTSFANHGMDPAYMKGVEAKHVV